MSSMRNCAPIVGCTLGLVLVSMAGKVSAQQAAPASAQDSQPEAQQQVGTQAAQAAPAATDNQTASSPTPSNIHAAPAQAPAEAPPASAESGAPPAQAPTAAGQQSMQPNEITEDEIRKLLAGKELFLRGGYLDNILAYNEHGVLIGRAAQGSYTLSGIQIDKVRLTKHKLELEGQRYGLHFLGELPFEDPTTAVDRVNITPKKKVVKITIDRELVVKPKEKKEKEKGKAANTAHQGAAPAAKPSAPGTNSNATAQSAAAPAAPVETGEAGEAQAEIAAAPPEDRPADAKSVTVTTSQAHANGLLTEALGNVFAQGFDDRMMASMPEFWKLYYQAAAAKTDYRPADPAVLRQNEVDTKARLASTFEPPSNEYAQNHGVAGMCLYHVVIGADGKAREIAVARPIGFGLDESAVDAIRKATFEPAVKDGKPVPVMLNLVVQFRIYSKRTAVAANPSNEPSGPSLPGPYSIQQSANQGSSSPN